MRCRMADFLISKLYDSGAETIFFVPGTGNMFLTDALIREKRLTAVSVHHEQAGAMAALTYAKLNEKIGACVVTTGCGGTNAITGLLHAYQDNVPCVFVSGQASRNQTVANSEVPLRQKGRQETDIISIVKPLTKYAVMLNSAEDTVYEIEKSIYISQTGRKGPVWIDVPMDIQNSIIDTDKVSHFEPKAAPIPTMNEEETKYLLQMLNTVERPVLLVGNGVRLSDAISDLREFAEKFNIPVVYTRLGHDLLEFDHPLRIGMVGMLGANRSGNFAAANADLLIVVGSRLSINTTGYEYEKFARAAMRIVVDIDESEHQKNTIRVDKFIHSDAKAFFVAMNNENTSKNYREWVEKCSHYKTNYKAQIGETFVDGRINMYAFIDKLSDMLPSNAVVISDAGNSYYTVTSGIKPKADIRSITSGAQAEMGYAIPGSVGAAFAGKGAVFAISGDGSIMMNIQELATIVYRKLNVKICVMNNNGYSSIRYLMNESFRRTIGTDRGNGLGMPDFEKLANAFGLPYLRIDEHSFESGISELVCADGPLFCEVMCMTEQPFLFVGTAKNSKKRIVNRPLEDQMPFIDRETFKSEMLIPDIDE